MGVRHELSSNSAYACTLFTSEIRGWSRTALSPCFPRQLDRTRGGGGGASCFPCLLPHHSILRHFPSYETPLKMINTQQG